MVKTPRTRHSKTQREPVTIELEPGSVSRIEDESETGLNATASAAEPDVATETVTDAASTEFEPAEPQAVTDIPDSTGEPVAEANDEAKPVDYDFDANEKAQPESSPDYPREETMAASPQPRRAGLSLLAAGLIGGAVTLAGAGALQFAGVLGAPNSGGGTPALGQVESEISALKAEIAALKEGAGGAASDASGKIDGLAQALDQVKADVASLQTAIQSGEAGDNAGLQALDAKMKEIEASIAGLGQGQGGGASPGEIAAINQKIAGVEALVKAAGEAGATVDSRLGAIEQSVTALSAKVDAAASQPKIALAIAASALKSAVDRGAPFLAEIETFAAIAPDAPELPALRTYAEKGVAPLAEIQAEADAAANAMIAAAKPVDENAGFFDRLLVSAESLVKVRPIGAVEGKGVPETVARMEAAVKAGDLATALAEFETLPETAKAAGAAFADKIRARADVEKLVDQAVAAAMQAA
jgi:hypothetical protein